MEPKKRKFDLQSLEFLNATVNQVYHRKKHYVSGKDLFVFKGILSGTLVQIERIFRYVYFSNIALESEKIDKRLFREQFPFLYEQFADNQYVIYDSDGNQEISDGITSYTRMLKRFRNINLHAIVSTPLHYLMKVDESLIQVFPKIADNVSYVENGELTIAGMIIMILAVLSQKDLQSFIANFVNIWGNALWSGEENNKSNDRKRALSQALNDTFRNNYEALIRKSDECSDIFESIFGHFCHETRIFTIDSNSRQFTLDLADQVNAPRYRFSCRLETTSGNRILTVIGGSNIGEYFEKDYVLHINDERAFINICKSVPPIWGIAYLYHNHIAELNALSDIDMEQLLKLNRPKFYRDKNLTILCSGSNFADMREIGKSVSSGVQKVFLNLEEKFVFELNIPVYGTYSKVSVVLEHLQVPFGLRQRLIALRNFAAHYGILNDFYFSDSENGFYIDLPFAVSTFYDLATFLDMKNDQRLAWYVRQNYHNHILNNLIGVKYKRIVQASFMLFRQSGEKVKETCSGILKSLKTVENSIIDIRAEDALISCAPYEFYFNIPATVYRFKDNKFYFNRLTLVKIQGTNLEISGTDIGDQGLAFFQTLATDFSKITSNGAAVEFMLIDSHDEGIVTVQTYQAKERNV